MLYSLPEIKLVFGVRGLNCPIFSDSEVRQHAVSLPNHKSKMNQNTKKIICPHWLLICNQYVSDRSIWYIAQHYKDIINVLKHFLLINNWRKIVT